MRTRSAFSQVHPRYAIVKIINVKICAPTGTIRLAQRRKGQYVRIANRTLVRVRRGDGVIADVQETSRRRRGTGEHGDSGRGAGSAKVITHGPVVT